MSNPAGTHGDAPSRLTHPDPKRNGKLETFTAADLMMLSLPAVNWIVEDILPQGVTLLAGKPKMGKSWMALGLALAVATGGLALGKKQAAQGEVLYLALEDNPRRLHRRVKKLLGNTEASPGLHINLECRRLDDGGIEALDGFLEDHPDTKLVIVDTLARLKPRVSGRRSQYDEDRDSVDSLVPLADKHGVAILLVHHLREMQSDDPLDMITGSVGLIGSVDGALVLKRERGKADAYLHIDGRDIENPTELALEWNPKAATWTILGDAEEYRMSEGRRTILAILENTEEPLGPKVIHEMLSAKSVEMGEGAVRQMLSQMAKDSQVKNLGRGKYVHPAREIEPDNADTLT